MSELRRGPLSLCVAIATVWVLAALCTGAGAEPAFEIYERPNAAVSGGKVYLFAAIKDAAIKDAASKTVVCLRQDAEGEWHRLAELRADCSCVTAADGMLYLFLPKSVIGLNAANCKKTAEAPWPFNWRAQSAMVAGGRMTAFGVVGGRLQSASPAAVNEGEVLGEKWDYEAVPVEGQGSCVQVRAVLAGGKQWLFWTTKGPADRVDTLWAAELAGGKPERTSRLATIGGHAEFSALEFDGEPMIIYAGLPERLKDPAFVSYRRRRENVWRPDELARSVTNVFNERTQTLSAVSAGEKVYLFLGTEYRILGATYDGAKWTRPRAVLSDKSMDVLIDHFGILLGALGAAALVVLASLVRSTFLPRRAIIAGVEYEFARWWQRGGAYLLDVLIAIVAVMAIHVLARHEATVVSASVAMFSFEMFYFTVCEARSGKTIGKRLFGIITVSRNGGYPNWGQAAARNLPRALLDSLSLMAAGAFLALVAILNTRSSQRLGDLAAGTHVVKEHSRR
ncbi:MAG: RDD family protein [Planctomycetota bacterium]